LKPPLLQLIQQQPALARSVALAGGGLLMGQWLLSDLLHIPGGGLGLLAAGAGLLWLRRSHEPPQFDAPETLSGWIDRCNEVLDQFDAFEAASAADSLQRRLELNQLIERDETLRLAVVCVDAGSRPALPKLQGALTTLRPVELSVAHPLPTSSGERIWPAGLADQDLILFSCAAPLMAADLLWLQQLPEDQPGWLLVTLGEEQSAAAVEQELMAQLGSRWQGRLLVVSSDQNLRQPLQPLRRELASSALTSDTRQRLLADLHRRWQVELECLRRGRFQQLQRRTQWLVAGSVFASPLTSVDLLAVAVANGLMIQEMAQIWGTSIKTEVLQEAAAQLARAALAQGVVEWTGQTLLGLAKLDGGSWLAAGAIQSLSAAYLTRVVGRSMADWLALSAGVDEPDLVALKQQAPLLVSRAAQEERMNWSGFLKDSQQWLLQATS
tara:strand:- start:370 stop:1689 length:1320 start_codon:yes stop_codon:yes gene_type:complete